MLIGANLITNDTTLPITEVAPLVEAAGLDVIFQGEHSHIPTSTQYPMSPDGAVPDFYRRFPDLFVTLAAAAAVTTTLRLGTGVVLPAEHQPLRLAKAVASLDQISGGRVDFGVGYGWNAPETANNGVNPSHRRRVTREHVEVISRLWAEDVVEHIGTVHSFTPSWSLPKPVQRASAEPAEPTERVGPPILFGASAGPKTFADIIEIADGWYPLAYPGIGDDAARLRALADDAGRATSVTAIEMAGQAPGVAWYCDDDAAHSALASTVDTCVEADLDRLVIGVPVDSRSHLEEALAALADIAQQVA